MKKIKNLLRKNSVWHFLRSYMLVLMLPVFIITVGILVVYRNMESENRVANQIKMEHSVQLIDKSISALHSLAAQGTGASAVKKMAALDTVETANILDFKEGVDALTTILKYQEQGVGFIEAHYVYFLIRQSMLFLRRACIRKLFLKNI